MNENNEKRQFNENKYSSKKLREYISMVLEGPTNNYREVRVAENIGNSNKIET